MIDYDNDNIPPLILKPDEALPIAEILRRLPNIGFGLKVCDRTVRRYFKRYKLGAQSVGNAPIYVSYPGFYMVLHGDFEALELLRDGHRDHPRVRRYFDELGVPA